MVTDGAVVLGSGAMFGILLAIHVTQAILCSSGTAMLARVTVPVLVLVLATTIGAIVSLLVCSRGIVSPVDAFTKFENNTGWSNNGWAFILSFTQPMWSLTGYDSAAHIAEETSNAAWAAPVAIMTAVLGTEILGWLMYIAISFATASVSDALQSNLVLPIGDVLLNVLGRKGTFVLWWSIVVLQYLCGCSQVVDASRVTFAFSRDNALPGSRWWKQVNPRTYTPLNAVWFVVLLSAICGTLSFSAAGFDSLASASVIGFYISYVTPIYFRITSGNNKFQPGPFHLGRWSRLIGAVAVIWVTFMVVMMLFPWTQTPGPETMNYSVVIVLFIFLFSSGSWVFSARHWFTGPIPNVDVNVDSKEK